MELEQEVFSEEVPFKMTPEGLGWWLRSRVLASIRHALGSISSKYIKKHGKWR
jgi:hypothetical protein